MNKQRPGKHDDVFLFWKMSESLFETTTFLRIIGSSSFRYGYQEPGKPGTAEQQCFHTDISTIRGNPFSHGTIPTFGPQNHQKMQVLGPKIWL